MTLPPEVARFVVRFRLRLQDRRFWIIQALVIGISVGHTGLEAAHWLGLSPDLYLLPVSTYFIPAVYAGLNFGLEGALPTSLWCCLLVVPNVVFFHHGMERVGIGIQLAIMVAVAVVVARRVETETAAKQQALAAQSKLEEAQESLQSYLRLATEAQEEERKRLARELHDDTIQSLLIVKGDLDSAGAQAKVASVAEVLHRSQASLARTIDGVRRFSRDLRPSLLDDLGLVDAIDWLVADVRKRSGIQLRLVVRGSRRRLPPVAEVAVFRIVQEALRNVERHSGARSGGVWIGFLEHGLEVVVADDGTGFDDRVSPGGAGLLGMRERAKLAGGELRVKSRRGRGLRVHLRLPISIEQSQPLANAAVGSEVGGRAPRTTPRRSNQ